MQPQENQNEPITYNGGQAAVQPSPQPPVGVAASDNTVSQQPVQPEAAPAPGENQIVQWQASEFIDHQKTAQWFLPLIIGVLTLGALMYLITRNILSTVVVVLGGATFLVFAKQKPRTLSYALTASGITIGQKKFLYDDFRTFSIVQEGAIFSVFLEPIKRFMPPLSIYFDPNDGEKIFDILAQHIPHQQREVDPVEKLMRRIRF